MEIVALPERVTVEDVEDVSGEAPPKPGETPAEYEIQPG